jgi:thiol-disulfide isomerase/thioredoxin
VLSLLLLVACNTVVPEKKVFLRTGEYSLVFKVAELDVPVRLSIDSLNQWRILNWDEMIVLDSILFVKDSFHIELPLFNTSLDGHVSNDSTLTGIWSDHSRDSLYTIPFVANFKSAAVNHFVLDQNSKKITYDVTFSPDNIDDKSKAVGVFYQNNTTLVGTFLTESGDYRYLEGDHTGNSLHLSSFDGAHLFYFCANVSGENLTDGKFYSGKHWSEDWMAVLNPLVTLRDPDSITYVQNKEKKFQFCVQNFDGDSILFDSTRFAGHVSVIQIFGSWCPNCTDESMFMKSLYDKYHDRGLEIIPIAFERTTDLKIAKASVQEQFEELGLSYTPFYGGPANKGHASEVFSALSKITSYPTTIFVDDKGVVRKIHTGFYGPGTGEHYEKHCTEMSVFIEELLSKKEL